MIWIAVWLMFSAGFFAGLWWAGRKPVVVRWTYFAGKN